MIFSRIRRATISNTMSTHLFPYELGWGVFDVESDTRVAWHQQHADAFAYSEMLASWNGPDLLGLLFPSAEKFNPEVIIL